MGLTPETLGVLAAGCAVIGFTADRIFHPSRKISRRFEEFLNDWNGQPERLSPDGKFVIHHRVPGVPERLATIETQLNGGGIGAGLDRIERRQADHENDAHAAREQLETDVRETRTFVAEAVTTLTTNQQQLEQRIDLIDRKVTDRLFTLEDAERGHRAMLHELGMDVDIPARRAPRDDTG